MYRYLPPSRKFIFILSQQNPDLRVHMNGFFFSKSFQRFRRRREKRVNTRHFIQPDLMTSPNSSLMSAAARIALRKAGTFLLTDGVSDKYCYYLLYKTRDRIYHTVQIPALVFDSFYGIHHLRRSLNIFHVALVMSRGFFFVFITNGIEGQSSRLILREPC